MKRIAIDMDEVIADSNKRFIEWYERDYQLKIIEDDFKGKYFVDIVNPEHKEDVGNYLHKEGFFKDLEVMENSREVISELAKKYEIFIATAAMEFPTSFIHKYEWMKKHFSFITWRNIVFCGDKSIIHADYLIDDHVKHFKNFKGQGILFTSPHNIYESWSPRVNNWLEVGKMLL